MSETAFYLYFSVILCAFLYLSGLFLIFTERRLATSHRFLKIIFPPPFAIILAVSIFNIFGWQHSNGPQKKQNKRLQRNFSGNKAPPQKHNKKKTHRKKQQRIRLKNKNARIFPAATMDSNEKDIFGILCFCLGTRRPFFPPNQTKQQVFEKAEVGCNQ